MITPRRGSRLYKSWCIAESVLLAMALIFATPVSGDTLDSGTQTIPVQDDDLDGMNDTRMVVTDNEYGDVTFRKTDADLNSSFRIRTDTDTWTHTIDVVNLREVSLPGTPDEDYLGNMTADEFFDGMVEHGSVTFRLRGTGNIQWTFTDLPDNIISIKIDDEFAQDGVDYELDGNDLTLTLSMSEHDVTAYFGTETLTADMMCLCAMVAMIGVIILMAYMWTRREQRKRQVV